MGSKKISAPPPRDYAAEMEGAIKAQLRMMPQLIDAERQYLPIWQQVQAEKMKGQMDSMLDMYGKAIPTASRIAMEQQQAVKPLMQDIGTSAYDIYKSSLGAGASGLLSKLQEQAMSDLQAGRSLSPEERRQAEQAARYASQARGMQSGNQAIALEVLSSNSLANAREAERRNFASNVYGLSEASFGNAMNMFGAPMLSVASTASPAAFMNSAGNMIQGLGPQLFTGESGYNAALISSNRKEQMDAAIANQNSSNARFGAVMGFAGQVLGGGAQGWAQGVASGCWVARCVYGEDNPVWLVFQNWMLNKSPDWFRELYLTHGESFAKFISDKPMFKYIVRKLMDIVVDGEIKEAKVA